MFRCPQVNTSDMECCSCHIPQHPMLARRVDTATTHHHCCLLHLWQVFLAQKFARRIAPIVWGSPHPCARQKCLRCSTAMNHARHDQVSASRPMPHSPQRGHQNLEGCAQQRFLFHRATNTTYVHPFPTAGCHIQHAHLPGEAAKALRQQRDTAATIRPRRSTHPFHRLRKIALVETTRPGDATPHVLRVVQCAPTKCQIHPTACAAATMLANTTHRRSTRGRTRKREAE